METLKNFAEGVTLPLLLSLFGGAARAMRYGVRSWRQFAGSLLVSGFAGVVVHLLLQETELSASVKAALVGLSGYSGGVILDGLALRLQQGVAQLPGRPARPSLPELPDLPDLPDMPDIAGRPAQPTQPDLAASTQGEMTAGTRTDESGPEQHNF